MELQVVLVVELIRAVSLLVRDQSDNTRTKFISEINFRK